MAFGHGVLESSDAVGSLELHLSSFAMRFVFGIDVGPQFDPDAATVVVGLAQGGGVVRDGGVFFAVKVIAVVFEMGPSVGEVELGLGARGLCGVVFILADQGFVRSYWRTRQRQRTRIHV